MKTGICEIRRKGIRYGMSEKRKNSKDLFEAIGEKNGVSAGEVRKEMEKAIMEAYNASDPEQKAEFKKRFGDRLPTPEEFICSLAMKIKYNG